MKRSYAQRLREAGVSADVIEFSNLTHGFYMMTGIVPAADKAVDGMLERLKKLLPSS